MRSTFAAVLLLAALSACGGADSSKPTAEASPTEPLATVEVSTPAPTATVEQPQFPEGYPKVVKVSSLPDQVRNWYEMSDMTQAVAIAEGVWTELPPGAEMEDAIAAGSLDGFCASIKAYERKYTEGEAHGGTCW